MDSSIELPREVPVMTMRDTVFFPRVVLPLYIFEERYRQMLADVLEGNRMFAIVRQNPIGPQEAEPPCAIGTVGLVRASSQNDDGTSNLVLQGLSRVRVVSVLREEPYRRIAIEPLEEDAGAAADELETLRATVISQMKLEPGLTASLVKEFADIIPTIEAPEVFVDVAASALLSDANQRQALLEARDTRSRLEKLASFLDAAAEKLAVFRQMQGDLNEDDIGRN